MALPPPPPGGVLRTLEEYIAGVTTAVDSVDIPGSGEMSVAAILAAVNEPIEVDGAMPVRMVTQVWAEIRQRFAGGFSDAQFQAAKVSIVRYFIKNTWSSQTTTTSTIRTNGQDWPIQEIIACMGNKEVRRFGRGNAVLQHMILSNDRKLRERQALLWGMSGAHGMFCFDGSLALIDAGVHIPMPVIQALMAIKERKVSVSKNQIGPLEAPPENYEGTVEHAQPSSSSRWG
jgi:hypothetical protein